jgi:putative nucleotidyltransferase with HDIG domain
MNNLMLPRLEENWATSYPNFTQEKIADREFVPNTSVHRGRPDDAGRRSETGWDDWRFDRVFEESIRAMGQLMELRDPYTASHQERVACICVEIATAMHLSPDQIKGLRLAALIHDIGKMTVPGEILCKPGCLSAAEFDIIKAHPMAGYLIAREIDFPWPIASIILHHHERMNGSGYPNGLIEREIELEARILSLADVIEAMSSNRPYRPSLGLERAIQEISQNKGVLYDCDVVDACLECLERKALHFLA